MEKTIEKLQNLHKSVQKLETVLQEVWSIIDEISEDDEFRELKKKVKQSKELALKLEEYENYKEDIPEDGTVVLDFDDAISDLIDWMKENK